MINKSINQKTLLKINKSVEGETIEMKVERIVSSKEPITDGAPLIYTDRRDGTRPEYDIRTDRFEVAIDAMDTVAKTTLAKRAEYYKKPEETSETKTE